MENTCVVATLLNVSEDIAGVVTDQGDSRVIEVVRLDFDFDPELINQGIPNGVMFPMGQLDEVILALIELRKHRADLNRSKN